MIAKGFYLIMLLGLLPFGTAAQQVYFVDSAATGLNNGTSWQNAFTDLQSAFLLADSLDEVWVAKGTYYPTQTNVRTAAFVFKSGVGYYGGFSGTETSKAQRDWVLNPTIMSGEIGNTSDSTDNSNHVVFSEWIWGRIVFDGFIVERGYGSVNNTPTNSHHGGGMNINETDGLIKNCVFRNNTSLGSGGGVWVNYSSIVFEDCKFYFNNGDTGGGVYDNSGGYYINCEFHFNKAGRGGGMVTTYSTFYNCTFKHNQTTSVGGGIFSTTSFMFDCAVDSNTAGGNGGGIYQSGSLLLYNTSVSHNTISSINGQGGGIFMDNNPSNSIFNIFNSRIIGNFSPSGGGGVYNSFTKLIATNSIFAGNSCTQNGGAIKNLPGSTHARFSNCNFIGNTAAAGSVIYDYNNWYDGTAFDNCIMWGNQLPLREKGANTLEIVVRNNILQDTLTNPLNQGNLYTDPLLTDVDGVDNIIGNDDDNYIPISTSPAVNGGLTDTTGLYLIPSDITGTNPRIADGRVDIGVYEWNACNLTIGNVYAGRDTTFCNSRSQDSLRATLPTVGVGNWYVISGGGIIHHPYLARTRVTNLSIGNNVFEWRVTNCNATVSDTIVITVIATIPKPTITASGPLVVCAGDSVTLSAPSGYSGYQWSNGATTQQIRTATAGSYRVRVSDGNICTSAYSDFVTISNLSAPAKPSITVVGGTTLCGNQTVLLTGPSSPSNYRWSNGETTRSITVSVVGNYVLHTIGSNGCWSPASDTIRITSFSPQLPPTLSYNDTMFCSGQSMTITASSGFASYNWSTGQTGQSISINTTTPVFVYATDGNGCRTANSDTVYFTQTNLPVPVVTYSGALTICQGDSVMISGPAGFSGYQWSDGVSTASRWVMGTLSVTLRVTDSNGCVSPPSAAVVVTAVALPSRPVVSPSGPVSFCQGQSVTLSGPAGFSQYVWQPSGNTRSITVNTSGTYSLYVVNSQGCRSTASLPVTVTVHPLPPKPTVTAQGPVAFCYGDSVVLFGPAGYGNYIWNGNNGSQNILVKTTGTYSLRVTDTNGCQSAQSDEVVVELYPTPMPPVLSLTDTSVCGEGVVLVSSTPSSIITWSNGHIGPVLEVAASGFFTAQIQDANGCISLPSEEVSVVFKPIPAGPIIQFIEPDLLTCNVEADLYQWYLDSTLIGEGSQLQITTMGTYYVEVMQDGCSAKSDPYMHECFGQLPQSNTVYPNPTLGSIDFSFVLSSDNEKAHLHVFNAVGQKLIYKELEGDRCGVVTVALDLSAYPAGVYSVKVTSGKDILEKRIVKN